MHSGIPIYGKDLNDHIQWRSNNFFNDPLNSVWWDPYLEPIREELKSQFHLSVEEPPGLELQLNSLDINMTHDMPKAYIHDDSLECESGYSEHGEWIFDYERQFFANKDPCSRDDEK